MINALLLTITTIVLFAGAILVFRFRIPGRQKNASEINYTSALNYLIAGEKAKAFSKLRQVIKTNTANIDAYIKIGDILREEQKYNRAIKIHRGLTVRTNLGISDQIEINKSLLKDYHACKQYEKAFDICEHLLTLTKNEIWVQKLKLMLLEENRDWDEAYNVRRSILKQLGEVNLPLLALYKVQAGIKLTEMEKERDARSKFSEAIKLDKQCAPAYLYMSDSYIREKKLTDALDYLKTFIERVPNLAYLAFDRLKHILFEEGHFGTIEKIYRELLMNHPKIDSIRFALADLYEQKGELKHACELCEKELKLNPDSLIARRYLVKYYSKLGKNDSAFEYALELVNSSFVGESNFRCSHCNYTTNQPYWYCPKCNEWNTYLN